MPMNAHHEHVSLVVAQNLGSEVRRHNKEPQTTFASLVHQECPSLVLSRSSVRPYLPASETSVMRHNNNFNMTTQSATITGGNANETTSLLLPSPKTDMEPALNDVEGGYGAQNGKDEEVVRDGYATSDTASSSTNTASIESNDEESQENEQINKRHYWLIPFFINIFLACASFSIVMPSLTPYLLDIGAPLAFLPWVVSSYSVGEMLGSVLIGYYYEYAAKKFKTAGRGPRSSLMICMCLGVIGSSLYSAAGWAKSKAVAKYCLLIARLIQGLWTGGQQAVEQAYLSAAVHPSKRTEYTATLSTCAVLGFVMGPTIGALLSIIDTTIFGLPVNADNSAGIFMMVATSLMLIQTALFFDGKDDTSSGPTEGNEESNNETSNADSRQRLLEERPVNYHGVAMCMVIFYVHYYSFAVQETITTPMVMILYRWDALKVNLLFIGAGIMSLITSFAVRYLTRCVEDRTMLVASIFIGFLGSIFLVDLPFNSTLPVWRFLLGFSLITIAFPVGRNVVLGIFGSVLGEVNQGRWMGIIFAISAFPRVVGPFISLELLTTVDWQTWLEFGITSGLFGMTLLVTWRNIDGLIPHADFDREQKERYARLVACHSPISSPILRRRRAINRESRE